MKIISVLFSFILSFNVFATISIVNSGDPINADTINLLLKEAKRASFLIDANISGAPAGVYPTASTNNNVNNIVSHSDLTLTLTSFNTEPGVKIACNNAPATGNICSGSNEAIGLNFNITDAGLYEVCYAASIGGIKGLRMSHTSNTDDTVIVYGKYMYSDVSAYNYRRNCQKFHFTAGEHTVKVFSGYSGGAPILAQSSEGIPTGQSDVVIGRGIKIEVRALKLD